MAFESKVTHRTITGNKRMHYGTYTNGTGDTGGNIATGLSSCQHINLQPTGEAASATAPSVNESLPVAGSAVTIVTADGEDGLWIAVGY